MSGSKDVGIERTEAKSKLRGGGKPLLGVFAILDFVFHAKRLLSPAVLPAFLRNHVIRLRESLGGKGMGAKITLQALNGELREFFLGASGMDHVFVVQPAEFFEETDCAIRRVISENGKAHAFAVGFELFVFVITGFPNLERDLKESAYDAEFEIAQSGFDLHAFGAVVVINMLDLMTEEGREVILAGDQVQQSFADVDGASGKRQGIDHVP